MRSSMCSCLIRKRSTDASRCSLPFSYSRSSSVTNGQKSSSESFSPGSCPYFTSSSALQRPWEIRRSGCAFSSTTSSSPDIFRRQLPQPDKNVRSPSPCSTFLFCFPAFALKKISISESACACKKREPSAARSDSIRCSLRVYQPPSSHS